MTLTFHALWMLCALGAVVFASVAASSVRTSAAFAGGFAIAALLTSGSALPDPVWTGGLASLAAAAYLFKPRLRLVSVLTGGYVSGAFAAMLEVQGLPVVAAIAVAGALVILTMRVTSTRPGFAPDVLKDEALLGVMVLGLAVAVIPGVLDGWQAATNLSGGQERGVEPVTIPTWTLALILASSSLGAVYTLWSRR